MGSLFVAILLIIIIVSVFYRNTDNAEKKEQSEKEIIARLKARYQEALKGSDRAQALKLGRDYYAYLRNSRTLPSSDEEAIARDLAGMQ